MAVIPIIQQTWDTTSYVNPTRMNNIETNLGILSKATGIEYSTGVSVKDKIDSVDGKLTGKVLSGAIANATTKTLDVIEGVGIIFIYRASSGLYAMVTQYNTTFTTVGGQLPSTITLGYANNKITITNNVGYTIGYTVINNPWA